MKNYLSISRLGHFSFVATMALALAVTMFPLSGCNIVQQASERLEDPVQVQKYADQIQTTIQFGVARTVQTAPERADRLRAVVLSLDVLIDDRVVLPGEVLEVFEKAGIFDMESSTGFYAIMSAIGLYDILFRENVNSIVSGDINFLPFLVALRDGISGGIADATAEGASPFTLK